LNLSDYSPRWDPNRYAETKLYVGWGHRYPVDDFLPPDYLKALNLVDPWGERRDLSPGPGGFLATRLQFETPGGYILCGVKKPGFYTMYEKAGKIHHKIGPKEGLKDVIRSVYFEQYAKALIAVGEVEGNLFERPVGHRLEIIPLANPYRLGGDGAHFLMVKVLHNGKPAKFVRLYATYLGFSTRDEFAVATLTDDEGVGRIRLLHWGPWLVKAVMEFPSSWAMKEKSDEISLTATLTFQAP
jgi:hypothetical protein